MFITKSEKCDWPYPEWSSRQRWSFGISVYVDSKRQIYHRNFAISYFSLAGWCIYESKNNLKIQELKFGIKEILIEELNDEEVKTNINKFLSQLAGNQNVKKAFITLIQDVFSSEESVETLINLLKKGITNEEVQKSLAESINFGVR